MDISAGFGGEDFVILSPATDISGAVVFANRMRMEIERAVYKFAGNSINITVSIGVFSIQAHSDSYSLADYIKRADDALYKAKQGGRNRVEVYDDRLTEKSQQSYCQVS
jgi:diguanylate cyclase (GGDEF)-like protein